MWNEIYVEVVFLAGYYNTLFLEIIIMGFILYHFLPFHCRLPTAIRSKLPFADGNEKHGKTTSIL